MKCSVARFFSVCSEQKIKNIVSALVGLFSKGLHHFWVLLNLAGWPCIYNDTLFNNLSFFFQLFCHQPKIIYLSFLRLQFVPIHFLIISFRATSFIFVPHFGYGYNCSQNYMAKMLAKYYHTFLCKI